MRDELPDSCFPNNWISTHKIDVPKGGLFVTYPMKAVSRQGEVNDKIIKDMNSLYKLHIKQKPVCKDQALEGTGSLVFDVEFKKIYCCVSVRADKETLVDFVKKFNEISLTKYKLVKFISFDDKTPKSVIYHTNVVLAILDKHSICCLDSVTNKK